MGCVKLYGPKINGDKVILDASVWRVGIYTIHATHCRSNFYRRNACYIMKSEEDGTVPK